MVAAVTQKQTIKNKTETGKQVSGQKALPPQPNKKNEGTDRTLAESLSGAVQSGLNTTATVVSKGLKTTVNKADIVGGAVLKEAVSEGVSKAVLNMIKPFKAMLQNTPGVPLFSDTIVRSVTPYFKSYLEKNNIQISVEPSAVVDQLLFGRIDKIDPELAKVIDEFVEKSMPEDIKAALTSGSLVQIAKVTGLNLTTGAKGLFSQIFNMEGSNKFTSPFKFIGAKTPLLKKLPKTFQPWAAGVGVLMFGGLIFRLIKKAAKLLISGTLLAGAGLFAKKMLDKVMSKPVAGMHGDKSQGAMGNAMNLLSSLAGAGGGSMQSPHSGSHQPGLGNMLSTATNLLGMFGKK